MGISLKIFFKLNFILCFEMEKYFVKKNFYFFYGHESCVKNVFTYLRIFVGEKRKRDRKIVKTNFTKQKQLFCHELF